MRTCIQRRLGRAALLPALLLAVAITTSACHDTIWVYSHPPGAELRIDGRPHGVVPEEGRPVDVRWFTFSTHHAELRWRGNVTLSTTLDKGLGAPNHPEYLIADGVLAIFFLVPGILAFCVNGYGPLPQQHFYAPVPVPSKPAGKPRRTDELDGSPPEG
jgi:hypothetical protein